MIVKSPGGSCKGIGSKILDKRRETITKQEKNCFIGRKSIM